MKDKYNKKFINVISKLKNYVSNKKSCLLFLLIGYNKKYEEKRNKWEENK